jgi:DNA-binding PadR family transcriptional regulator
MRESTTGFVILGVLATIGPSSGYDVRQFIEQSVSHFWNESFGQIYPELKRLRREGLVAPVSETPEPGRKRQRFRITPAGRRALREWLAAPAQPERVRVEFLVKLFFGHESGPAANRQHVEALAARHRERVGRLRQVGELVVTENPEDPQLVYWLLALRHGQVISEARVRWSREAARLLDAHERGGSRAVVAAWRVMLREDA